MRHFPSAGSRKLFNIWLSNLSLCVGAILWKEPVSFCFLWQSCKNIFTTKFLAVSKPALDPRCYFWHGVSCLVEVTVTTEVKWSIRELQLCCLPGERQPHCQCLQECLSSILKFPNLLPTIKNKVCCAEVSRLNSSQLHFSYKSIKLSLKFLVVMLEMITQVS